MSKKWLGLLLGFFGLLFGFWANPTYAEKTNPTTKSTAKKIPTTQASKQTTEQTTEQTYQLAKSKTKDPKWDRPYLLAAYGVTWLFFIFYLLTLVKRANKNEATIKQLSDRISQLESDFED